MAEIPLVRDELVNDVSKLRVILGYESQDVLSEGDSSGEGDYTSCEDKCDYTEDEIASGSSSGHMVLPGSNHSSQNCLESGAESSDNKLERCLALNRSYQHRINEIIEQVNEMILKNRDRQKKLLDEITESTDKEKIVSTKNSAKAYNSRSFGVFEAPYFRDINGQFAPSNEDTIIKDRNKEITAYVVPYKSWTDVEKKNLEVAVALNAKEILLNPLLMRKQVLMDKLKNKDLSESEYEAENAKLEKTNATIKTITETPKEECIGPRGTDADWLKISAIGLDGSRTAEECKMMWDNFHHPSINKEEWSEVEDNTLWAIAEQHGFHDWDSIAEKLMTSRTSWQCLRRYQQKLKRTHTRGPWSKSEDDLLRRVVDACRAGDYIPWHQVAYYLEGRTRTQIQNRWHRCICPDLRKGVWTLEEDVVLLAAIKKHGIDWTKVCNYLPGRNNTQCRERYKNTLEEGITLAGWTADEDLKLLRLVKKHGEGKWAMIALQMNGRLDNSIYQRFRLLKSKKPDILDLVDPDVTPEASILPTTIVRSGQCTKAIKRRKEVQEALKARNIKLESQDEMVTDTNQMRTTDQLLENRLSLLKYTRRVHRTHRRKKSRKDGAVDAALDAFLAPLLSLTGPLIKAKCLSMTGVEWMQAATTKLFLFKLFKCDDGTNKGIDIPEKNFKLFEETKEEIEKVFKHLIVGTHCEDTNSVVPVIPPNRATISGFKVVLSSRKRLILSAKKMKDLNIIPILTTKLTDSVQCLDCCKQDSIFARDSSCETQDTENNEIPPKTEKTSADDSDSSTQTPPPKRRKRKSKYDKLIAKYSKPLESIEQLESTETLENCQSTQDPCQTCERMKAFHIDFQLLQMRFLSTFFWPALLSTLVPDENETTDVPNENETADEENGPLKPKKVYRRKKRKQKKPWVTESLKRRHLEKNHTLREIKSEQRPIKRKGKYNKAQKNQPPTRRSTRCASKAVTSCDETQVA